MAQISVIVPVYQVEAYIGQCIESILNQTFQDFELILVDDGSTDQSGQICDRYAKRDERIQVLHKENEGVSKARNAGIEASIGNYICFVDADDRVDASMLEQCVKKIKSEKADVVRHGYTLELWKGMSVSGKHLYLGPDFKRALSHYEIQENMEQFWANCSNYVWNYFFKREAIGMIRFPDIPISEDHIFVLKVLGHAKKVAFISQPLYYYCMRMGSNANHWKKEGISCQIKMVKACEQFMDEFHITGERKDRLMTSQVISAYSYIIYLLSFPDCTLKFKKKMQIAKVARRKLKVDHYKVYTKQLSQGFVDSVKTKLICNKKEEWMILFGPSFLRIVRGSR